MTHMGSNTVIVDVPFRITNCHFKTRDCFLYGGLVCVNLSFARVRLKYGKTGNVIIPVVPLRNCGKAELRETFSRSELIESRWNFRRSAADFRDSGTAGNIFSSETDWKQMKFPLFRCGIPELRDSGIAGNILSSETYWKQIKFPLFHCGITELRETFSRVNWSKADEISVVPLRNCRIAELWETFSRVELIECK